MAEERIPITTKIPSKATPWDDGTSAYTGERVEEYIKGAFEGKVGCIYHDAVNERYLAFADDAARDEYISDNSKTALVLGVMSTASASTGTGGLRVSISSALSNVVSSGSTGNAVRFVFASRDGGGQTVPESVTCVYTIANGGASATVTETYRPGTTVSFNVDKYLRDGDNTVSMSLVGVSTGYTYSTAVTFKVVNLGLSIDNTDEIVSGVYSPGDVLSVDYTVSGSGSVTKTVEWYLDGERVAAQANDSTTDSKASKRRGIAIPATGFGPGVHSLQARAQVYVGGDFYSKTLYREFMVPGTSTLVALALDFDDGEIRSASDALRIGGITQYSTLPVTFGVHSPGGAATTDVKVLLDGTAVATLTATSGSAVRYNLPVTGYSSSTLELKAYTSSGAVAASRSVGLEISQAAVSVREITADRLLKLDSTGKSNSSSDRDKWTYSGVSTAFSGFKWNQVSGWTDNGLYIDNGSRIETGFAPLDFNRTSAGRTIEFEFRARNVEDDDAVLCDLTTNGVGLQVTASAVILKSSAGNALDCRFKKEERVRVAVVITRTTGEDPNMAFIYVNGIVSRAMSLGGGESFKSAKALAFAGTDGAEIELRQVTAYGAALTEGQILNNYILYRDTPAEMLEIYSRNDVEDESTSALLPDKLVSQLPVMIVTGPLDELEKASTKETTITADVRYTDAQRPELSFTMENAVMSPQGTSSLGYPKKNFKLYAQKNAATKLYDSEGNEVASRLYSFTENAQPVKTWCLKADYAESSGTHNTGVARLWNDVLYNATLDGDHVFRTAAQAKALESNYGYDVRTTVDGFPILLFYRKTADGELIFIGKYNFNNDKSTESVFGFRDIPGFDNSKVECWEFLTNGSALCLFQSTDGWNAVDSQTGKKGWESAFEGRYPDGNSDTAQLKAFADWVVSCKGNASKFNSEKASHLDLPKVAAYYVYLMRFGAVDQVVKNAMMTTEDGAHWFFINYDNDTINGLRNDGPLVFPPTIDRQSLDPKANQSEGAVYAYAGHESVLWNLLEGDAEFMALVREVDLALYNAGLKYSDVIDMFDNKQAGKWCEKVYNRDARYKYIGPYVNDDVDNLKMLQGSRQSHRRWWLSSRFSLYDARFVSGEYKSDAVEFKVGGAPVTTKFGIVAGTSMEYGFGTNNNVLSSGVSLAKGDSHDFWDSDPSHAANTYQVGDPVRVYAAPDLRELDIHNFITSVTAIDISKVGNERSGTKLKRLVLGVSDVGDASRNTQVAAVSGLANATKLEELNIAGYEQITKLDLTAQPSFKTLKAKNSGLTEVRFAKGAPVETLELPAAMQSLALADLPRLTTAGLSVDLGNLANVKITGCPGLAADSRTLVDNWYSRRGGDVGDCGLALDGVDWSGCDVSYLLDKLFKFGDLDLRGKIALNATPTPEQAEAIKARFGANCFSPDASLRVTAPDGLFIYSEDRMLSGDSPTTPNVTTAVFTSGDLGTVTLRVSGTVPEGVSVEILGADQGYSLPAAIISSAESSTTKTVTLRLTHSQGGTTSFAEKTITIEARTYPTSSSTISGASSLSPGATSTYAFVASPASGINGGYYLQWSIAAPEGGMDASGSVDISSCDNSRCVIYVAGEGDFRIKCEIKRSSDNAVMATLYKAVVSLDAETLMTSNTNPEVLAICYDAGWCASPSKMTRTEAAAVTDDMFSTQFKGKTNITHFEEFEAFTGITEIDGQAFQYCTSLTTVTIPNSVTSIGDHAFESCSGLTTVTIPDSVTAIGSFAFSSCNGLTTVTIPNSVTAIGNSAFSSCTSLTSITIPDSVTAIESFAFFYCTSLTTVTIPNSVTAIGDYAFRSCSGLTTVTIPNSVTSIGVRAFESCTSLTTVNFNATNCTTMGSQDYEVFSGCASLTTVNIGSGVTKIPAFAFSQASGIGDVTIPASVADIGMDAFYNCPNVSFHGPYASDDNKCVVVGGVLKAFSGGHAGGYAVPDGVTEIGARAFHGASSLSSMSLPDTVATIGSSAFNGCTSLVSASVGNSLATLGDSAFSGCTSLASIDLPATIAAIGNYAFRWCGRLSEITIRSASAPSATTSAFGDSTYEIAGYDTKGDGANTIYVPTGATGYNVMPWTTPLVAFCKFTISYTL